MKGIDPLANSLQWLAVTSGEAVVQSLILQSCIHYSRTLVPALSVLWVCHPPMWTCMVIQLRSKLVTGHAGWGFLKGVLPQAKFSFSLCAAQSHLAWAIKKSADGHHLCWAWMFLKRPGRKMRQIATNDGLWVAQQEVWDNAEVRCCLLRFC